MKKQIAYLVLILSSGIFFAGFKPVYAETTVEIYKKTLTNKCFAIKNRIEDFQAKKNSKNFNYKKFSYQQEAYEKELDAYISLEKALSCMQDNDEGGCKNSIAENDLIDEDSIKNEKCRNKKGEEISDELQKLKYSAQEFQNSAKLFDEALNLYFSSNNIPLSKGNKEDNNEIVLDEILTDNVIIRAGEGFLYSTQERLHNVFRGELVKSVNRVLGTIAILYLFVLGVKFIMARGDTERLSQLKGQFAWITLGLAVISVAEFMGYEVFDPSGNKDILETGVSEANFASKIREIVRYFEYAAGGLMLINALISAYGLIMDGEEEDSISKEKQFLKSFLMGTAFILLAEVIVRILTLQDGVEGSARIAVKEVAGLVNFSLSFIGVIAVVMLVMAGLYYVISFGDEDQMGRAKKMIIASLAGTVISFSAYTIIRFLIV